MEITETVSDALRREFRITVGMSDLDAKLTSRLEGMKGQVQLKGFRPGKVPVAHLRKAYGKSMMGEIVQEAVAESSQKAVEDRSLRPAMSPQIQMVSAVEGVIEGREDLVFTMGVDLMPDFKLAEPSAISLTRPVAEVSDEDVQDSLKRLAAQQRTFEPKGDDAAAQEGDQLVIDFTGKLDGIPFEGGTAENAELVIGSGSFIPGFEEQLKGSKAGDAKLVAVTFPNDYPSANLAGKFADFDVRVKEVRRGVEAEVDESLATKLGLDSLDKLRDAARSQLANEFGRATRAHLKRALLDALDTSHSFDLPSGMVEAEFRQIWAQVEQDIKAGNLADEDKTKSEDELRAEFRKIAERRVRLGLVLSEFGRLNNVQVTQDELNRAVVAQARQYPGQEQRIFEIYRNNPDAVAQLRAPIFEDKVVDFLVGQVKISDHQVSRVDLFKDPDDLASILKAS
ncbi:MAG: trigger factor [Alphaproteobacteria bacterium]|nr:trigger factor [Alphaproteobacteria bacterium]